jgi:hypothetical protein
MNLPVLANPANEIARSMTARDYLSYSQVSTYQACPLKWYFQYVAGLPPEQVAASLVFGGASAAKTSIGPGPETEVAPGTREKTSPSGPTTGQVHIQRGKIRSILMLLRAQEKARPSRWAVTAYGSVI